MQSSIHVLLQETLLVLPRVFVSANGILQESVLMIDVNHVCMLFWTTHYCEVTLDMALGKLMSISGVLSEIPCIISRNRRNVTPCNGLVNKSSYISPVRQYFSDKSPFSIIYFIKKYHIWILFVRFILDYLPLFSMSILPILYWQNLISFTECTCPPMKYIDHRQCGKALSSPTILASVELLPFVFFFRDSSIIDPDPIDIIAPVYPFQSG